MAALDTATKILSRANHNEKRFTKLIIKSTDTVTYILTPAYLPR